MIRTMDPSRNHCLAVTLLASISIVLWGGAVYAEEGNLEISSETAQETGVPEEAGKAERGADGDGTEPDDASEAKGGVPEDAQFGDEITVRARPLRQIEERSLDLERRSLPSLEVAPSDQLGRFPDHDAAGAAQRLPGVTVISDQGDARLVVVRGLLPAYNSATLDGERMPAGEADERVVALDLLPTELLEAVELTKTLTPAMDGDAVGGAVNLVTRRPPADRGSALGVSLGSGWDDGSDGERSLATATMGGWMSSRRLGLNLSASRLDADRGVDSVEREWDVTELDGGEGVEIQTERLQDHTSERSRRGVGGSVEWHPTPGATLLLRGLWAEFQDLERRRARVTRTDEDGRTQLSELKDRDESQSLESHSASGHVRVGDWLVEPAVSWSRGEETEPDRLDTVFAAGAMGGAPGDYELEAFRTESDRSANEDMTARIDLSRSLECDWTMQAGVKWRSKDARRDDNLVVYGIGDDAESVPLSEVYDADWRPSDPFFGQSGFDLGPFADPAGARDLFRRLLEGGLLVGEPDPEDDLGDFEADENVAAAYVQFEGALSDRLSLLAGVRAETTDTSYRASVRLLDEDGEEGGRTPARGSGSYDEILPSVILRAAATDRDVLRLALTRALARPNLADLTPARLVIPEDEEILAGNPALVPTTSWNFDLQWQRELDPLGSVAVSLYRKELSDVIAFVRTEPADEESFVVVQPRNAGDASVTGVELSYRRRFRGLGLSANLTWADSEATFVGRPSSTLPGQAELSGSVVVAYELPRASVRWLYSYRDEILEELGAAEEPDLYLSERGQVDLSIQIRTSRRWSFFVEAFNLTEERVRRFEVSPDGAAARPIFEEDIGWWATFGVRFDG